MNSLPIATANLIRPHRSERAERLVRSQLTARMTLDRKTRTQAFALRHASYLAGGYIDERLSGLFSDPYDDLPNCVSIVVYKEELPVASVRLCTLDLDPAMPDWLDIPARHVFAPEVEQMLAGLPRQSGAPRVIEINRLVRHPDYANDFELVFVLFRFVAFMVTRRRIDMMLSCVRRNHQTFYKRLDFETIAGPRSYPELKFDTNLMVCPGGQFHDIINRYTILDSGAVQSGCYDGLFHGETVTVFGDK